MDFFLNYYFDFSGTVFEDGHFESILRGFGLTLKLSILAGILSLIWGLVLAVLRQLPGRPLAPIRWLTIAYIDIFRGVPLLLVLLLVSGISVFGAPIGGEILPKAIASPTWFGQTSPFWYGTAALTLTYGAYMAEVYRAGIEAVPRGQMEAARSLGMSHGQAMRYVIVPQAVTKVIPPLLNDFIALMKDTSLVSVHRRCRGRPGRARHPERDLQRVRPDHGRDPLPDRDDPAGTPRRLADRSRAEAHPARRAAAIEDRGDARTHARNGAGRRDMSAAERDDADPQATCEKRFGHLEVLRGVDLEVKRGEVVCVLGPSGSGKSTLLRTINLLEPPEGGSISPRGSRDHGQEHIGASATTSASGLEWSSSSSTCSRTRARSPTSASRRRRCSGAAGEEATEKARGAAAAASASPTSSTSSPTGSPAVSSSASRSPGRWRWTRT